VFWILSNKSPLSVLSLSLWCYWTLCFWLLESFVCIFLIVNKKKDLTKLPTGTSVLRKFTMKNDCFWFWKRPLWIIKKIFLQLFRFVEIHCTTDVTPFIFEWEARIHNAIIDVVFTINELTKLWSGDQSVTSLTTNIYFGQKKKRQFSMKGKNWNWDINLFVWTSDNEKGRVSSEKIKMEKI
jgi:hypothetical protein